MLMRHQPPAVHFEKIFQQIMDFLTLLRVD